jgi:hypothetical protein
MQLICISLMAKDVKCFSCIYLLFVLLSVCPFIDKIISSLGV